MSPVEVTLAASTSRAMPKSVSLHLPPRPIRTLAGFTSRCTSPWPCTWSRASATAMPMSVIFCTGCGPRRIASASVSPSTNSMTTQGRPLVSVPAS
jgi:hypothetical protein